MNTRAMAAAILLRIRDHGAYSNVLLPQATKGLSGPNQAFVYSLVTGALRGIREIDAVLETAAGRQLSELDDEVGAVLQIAIGEMMTDEKETVYATVNESVEAVKQLGKARASGLVNGVLRGLSRKGMPDLDGDKARSFSVPEWVLGRLTHDHGKEMASALLTGLRLPSPGVGIRVRPGAEPPAEAEAIPGIAGSYRVERLSKDQRGLVVGDAASSAVAQAVNAQPGELILDMASAPGGKTIAMWDDARGQAAIVAMDAHGRRILSARDRLRNEHVRPLWVHADGVEAPFLDETFDAVLLDAPCTGLGTLRRRPEIAMRLKTKAVDRLAEQQSAMLADAWRITKPGGRIVYSVCTLFAQETTDVVADYPAHAPGNIPGIEWGLGRMLAPHLTDTDGMFVSVIDR